MNELIKSVLVLQKPVAHHCG